jgi:hypothetical protein
MISASRLPLAFLVLSASITNCTKYRVVESDGGDTAAGTGGGSAAGGTMGTDGRADHDPLGSGGLADAGNDGGTGGLNGSGGGPDAGRADTGGTGVADASSNDAPIDAGSLTPTGGICQRNDECATANCSNSICCGVGRTGCGAVCVDLTTDSAHCGTCGMACPAGTQTCAGSHCLLVDGQLCTTGAACSSTVCSPFFVDADRDTYGTSATVSLCGVSPPAGYAIRSGDCCDSVGAINPGADFQNSIGSCNGISTWDYNCSGQIEKNVQTGVCGPLPACVPMPAELPDSSCGQLSGVQSCASNCQLIGNGPVMVGCR